MRPRIIATAASLGVIATVTLVATPAQAADVYYYTSSSAVTEVSLVGGAVTSGPTAASSITGTTFPNASSNRLAKANVPGLVTVDALSTKQSATSTGSLDTITSRAQVAGVDLLNGLITADAVKTVNTLKDDGTTGTGSTSTTFVDLGIAGQHLPVTIPKNFTLEIPGVAKVVLNESKATSNGPKTTSVGSALKITLLAPYEGAPTGSTITLNPTRIGYDIAPPTDATPVGGYAYVTRVNANVGSATVESGPTGNTSVPVFGTGNRTISNALAAVNLAPIITAAAVEGTSRATSVPVIADVENTAKVARINLLNGVVTADAVKSTATAKKDTTGTITTAGATNVVRGSVLGLPIPINAKPNTKLRIPGVVSVTVNEQVKSAGKITVTALRVKLEVARLGLPVGAELEIGVSSSWVG